MMSQLFKERWMHLQAASNALLQQPNEPEALGNGIFKRYQYPVLTAAHTPLHWRYDLDPVTNPFLQERFQINAVFNAGAIRWKDEYILVTRVEAADRKSFFAIAGSKAGTAGFRFREKPLDIPELSDTETNLYDMRLVIHADGWVYGLFCVEYRNTDAPGSDQTAAIAQCGIIRTRDLQQWERLPNLVTRSAQQRNVVLHPEWVNGQYAFYTRPQDDFIETGTGGGIALGYCKDITNAVITEEFIIQPKKYHTVYEVKNGLGPAPLKTAEGWLHLAHGVRQTAAGLRYVLYLFMTDLADITRVIYQPAGYFMAPSGEERAGDVPNVLFCNGWIMDADGTVYIYYASADTRLHVASSSIDQLLDYVKHTDADGYRSHTSVSNLQKIIQHNQTLNIAKP